MRRLPALLLLAFLGACTTMQPQQPAAAPGQRYVVFFTAWSAALDPEAVKVISAAAAEAARNPAAPVHVIGYADPSGSPQANVFMSRTRAEVVADQLVQDGVAAARIRREAEGATQFTGTSQESRRVAIAVGG